MNVAGVILAAGASRRMGTPKALLTYRGQTFADRLTAVLRAGGCDPVLLVAREAWAVAGASVIINPDPERGQLSSLQCGLAALPEAFSGVAFCPVDYPAVRASTVAALLAHAGTAPVIIPRHGATHGHPVLVNRSVVAELLSLPLTASARDVVRAYRDQTVFVDVEDAGAVQDVDTPEDYAALLGERA